MTFDMKRARHHADTGDLMKTTKWLYAALDEIERLQVRDAAMQAQIVENAKRIAELEEASAFECRDLYETIAKQRAALKKLGQAKRERGKALVEERARGNYFDESQDCEGYWWDRKNTDDYTQNQYRENARDQLRQEKLL